MPFTYYHKLSRKQQRIYDKSDQIRLLMVKDLENLQQLTSELNRLLPEGRSTVVQRICQQISNAITSEFDVPRVKVKVLATRPSNEYYELHGYYEPAYKDKKHTISVWMKTASRKQVVAFKTFLRTLIHELFHHLDYEYLQLDESYHTEGFYKRESSLFHQIVNPS
ncbi:MAG: hypothetical protein OEX03_02370 [Gammaproteobacteria bacterium]|nr:hypothetical protein [Gammaproteobacteria bacterium]